MQTDRSAKVSPQIDFPGFHDDASIAPEELSELTEARLLKVTLHLDGTSPPWRAHGQPQKVMGLTLPIIGKSMQSIPSRRELPANRSKVRAQ